MFSLGLQRPTTYTIGISGYVQMLWGELRGYSIIVAISNDGE